MHLYDNFDYELLASNFRSMQYTVQGTATSEERSKLKALPESTQSVVFDCNSDDHSFNEYKLHADRRFLAIFLLSIQTLPSHFECIQDSVWLDIFSFISSIQNSMEASLEKYRSAHFQESIKSEKKMMIKNRFTINGKLRTSSSSSSSSSRLDADGGVDDSNMEMGNVFTWEYYERMDDGSLDVTSKNRKDAIRAAIWECHQMRLYLDRGNRYLNQEEIRQLGTFPKVEVLAHMLHSFMKIQTIYKWLLIEQ